MNFLGKIALTTKLTRTKAAWPFLPVILRVGHINMMKTVTSKPDDYTIYCTDADSIHHSLNSIQASELLRQVKICSLLGKHVYVSGGHIFENPETTKLLLDNPALLESGIIVIGLRDDCRDFTDLLEMQSSLGKKLQMVTTQASCGRGASSSTRELGKSE